jgi:hypothetical protein
MRINKANVALNGQKLNIKEWNFNNKDNAYENK